MTCDSKTYTDESTFQILATVSGKSITVNEFIRRSEYTLRPPYARGSNPVHKKIVLNSLIAEKLLALEAEQQSKIRDIPKFGNYLQGRREQAMRSWLFQKEGVEKALVDTSDIRRTYKQAGRRYDIEYISLAGKKQADAFLAIRNTSESFAAAFARIAGDKSPPLREIEFSHPLDPQLYQALYQNAPKKGEEIGPLPLENGSLIYLHVKGWTDNRVITDRDIKQRWNDVKEQLTNLSALEKYEAFVKGVMADKSLTFNEPVFRAVVNLTGTVYFDQQSKQIRQSMFADGARPAPSERPTIPIDELDALNEEALLTVEGNTWRVRDFRDQLQRHPLVYRSKEIARGDFARQFKLAVADLVRDHYLTEEAYDRGYHQVASIERYHDMWADAVIALKYQHEYLRTVVPEEARNVSAMALLNDYMTPYIDSLQQKYADEIEIDVKAFESIQLTGIDMIAKESNVPFPIVVPAFPQVTTDHRLDYGQKQ